MVFNDEVNDIDRYGLIIHRLKIEYLTNSERKKNFYALDREDLVKLKEDLERAIEKEDLMRKDYGNEIKFIDLKD